MTITRAYEPLLSCGQCSSTSDRTAISVCSLATQRRCRTVINVQCKSASATSDDGERKRPRKGTAASRKRHGGSTGQHSDRAWKQTRGTGDASRVTSDPRSSEGRSQVLAPQKLTFLIKQAATPQQLLQLVQQYDLQFNYIHIASAATQLGQWYRKQQLTPGDRKQTEQLLSKLEQLLLSGNHLELIKPRELSNIIWSCSLLGYTSTPLYSRCLQAFSNKLRLAKSLQDVSNVLYGLAESGQQRVTQQQFDAILEVASRKALLREATPQGISNIIWSAATLSMCISEQDLQCLVTCLISKLADANTQHISNVLWALATMQQSIPDQLLWLFLNRLTGKLAGASSQDVCNTLWACGQFGFLPQQLLTALREQQLWHSLVPALGADELGQVAVALGALGHGDDQLMAALLQQALERKQQYVERNSSEYGTTSGSSNAIDVQLVCNLCWSVAVLDLQQHVPQVLTLVLLCAEEHLLSYEQKGLQQLQQVHLWLKDLQQPDAIGLGSVLTDDHLRQCEQAWVDQLQQRRVQKQSRLHTEVLTTLQQLPLIWRSPPAMEQLCEPDGMFSMDISGVTDDGVRLAIEADGPTHFRRPDNKPTGNTLYRNRALAARGYVVISVPVHEWGQLQGSQAKQQYLMELLQQRLHQHHLQQRQLSQSAATSVVAAAATAGRRRRSQQRTVEQEQQLSLQQQQQQQPQQSPSDPAVSQGQKWTHRATPSSPSG